MWGGNMRTQIGSFLAALVMSAGVTFAQAPTLPVIQESPSFHDTNAVSAMHGDPAPPQIWHDPVDQNKWWLAAEYLLWWFKDSPVPVPLATTTTRPSLVPT